VYQRGPVSREVEGLRGYRWWRVGLGGWLLSPWRESKPWTRSPNRAICLASRRILGWSEAAPHANGSPDASCQCGLYGLHEYPTRHRGPARFVWELEADFSGSGGLVLGVAEASGRALLGTEGWRAEFAAPRALYVSEWAFPNPDMEAVSLRYELPVYRDFDALHSEWGPGDVQELLAS
jgi:hypothetical protein